MTDGNRTRREQIQTTAARLFREKGYLATSMRDLATALQMKGGGSLYAHIKSKEDLLWDIATTAIDAFFAAVSPIIDSPLTPDRKLHAAMVAHMLAITAHLEASSVY